MGGGKEKRVDYLFDPAALSSYSLSLLNMVMAAPKLIYR
jgi:hypothetical protein